MPYSWFQVCLCFADRVRRKGKERKVKTDQYIRWPTGDMQHALSLHTQNQIAEHKIKNRPQIYFPCTNSRLMHTNLICCIQIGCCSTQIQTCCIQNPVAAHKLRPAAYKVGVAACKERCCCCYACFHLPITAVVHSVLSIV